MAEDDGTKSNHGMSAEELQKMKEAREKAKSVSVMGKLKEETIKKTADKVQTKPKHIMAYPEFAPVIKANRPPLVTWRRFLLALYLSAGATATMYILTKFILVPLRLQIFRARGEFYRHACEKVGLFKELLSEGIHLRSEFEVEEAVSPSDTVAVKLNNISTILRAEAKTSEHQAQTELALTAENLITYLNNHLYTTSIVNPYSYGNNSLGSPGTEDGKVDMVNLLKTEIRSVKGALLNIRNFPAPGASGGSK